MKDQHRSTSAIIVDSTCLMFLESEQFLKFFFLYENIKLLMWIKVSKEDTLFYYYARSVTEYFTFLNHIEKI